MHKNKIDDTVWIGYSQDLIINKIGNYMLRTFIPYEQAKSDVNRLLTEEKNRMKQIILLDFRTVTAYINFINQQIEMLKMDLTENSKAKLYIKEFTTIRHNHSFIDRQKNSIQDERKSILSRLKSLNKLIFDLDQQKIYLENKNKNEQFIMLTVLSDKIEALIKKPSVDEFDIFPKELKINENTLLAARESVTSEVLESHDVLMDNMRQIENKKNEMEKKLIDDQKKNIEQEQVTQLLLHQSQHEILKLRQQLDEQKKLIEKLQSAFEKNKIAFEAETKTIQQPINPGLNPYWKRMSGGK